MNRRYLKYDEKTSQFHFCNAGASDGGVKDEKEVYDNY
jgi:hypothetical protein